MPYWALREAEYQKLQRQAEEYSIVAPFDGVLVEFLKQPGEFVGPVDPNICVIAELTTLSADFLVPRRYRSEFELQQTIDVHFVESVQVATGKIYYISPFPNGETNTYTLKIQVPNPDRSLSAGERCQLESVTGKLSSGVRQHPVSARQIHERPRRSPNLPGRPSHE